MFKRKQIAVPTTQSTAVKIPDVFEKALASKEDMCLSVGNFLSVDKGKSFDELYELAEIARSKGLKGQVRQVGRRIVATALEQKGMSLLAIKHDRFGGSDITRLHADGNKEYLKSTGNGGEWKKKSLKAFDMNMPDNIIREIPQGIVDQADIFVPKKDDDFWVMKDPIIAIHIHQITRMRERIDGKDFYAGIYIWD